MPVSRLDKAYRRLVLSKFFTKGWGTPQNIKKLFEFRKIVSDRRSCFPLVSPNHPVIITKEVISGDLIRLEGYFSSPFGELLPDLVPAPSRTAYFEILLPTQWREDNYKPVCLHLAGTGDHFFFRRRTLMAKPLLKEAGIGAILLENPFYGMRKPKDQVWSCLHNVSDIFVMGGCLILESLVLFHWCKRNGLGPLGVTGISMGGHMASLAATNWPEPLALIPCLSWSTASTVFTQGVMSGAINWELLEQQYFQDEFYSKEIKSMIKVIDDFIGGSSTDDSYAAGKHFAKNFPESLNHVRRLTSETFPHQIFSPNNVQNKNSSQDTNNGNVLEEVLRESGDHKLLSIVERKSNLKIVPEEKPSLRDYLNFRSKAPAVRSNGQNKDTQRQEALRFMCGIMDECTHLSNFSVPVDTELIIAVTAKDDAYVPREGISDIRDIWPGAEVRYLDAGHVKAYLMHQKVFRTAIVDGFERLKKKYLIKKDNLQNRLY